METYFCKKGKDGRYQFFFKNRTSVRMCGVENKDIVSVTVREALECEENSHFALLELEENEINYIYENIQSVKLCSGDFFQSVIKAGKARFVRVVVEEAVE